MLEEMEEESKTETNSIVSANEHQTDSNINTLNLFDARQLAAAENLLSKIMRSDKSGIKSVNDGIAILLRAQDLGLPFSTSIEHIHVINGKTGVDVHIIKALLLKAGITWEVVKDYVPLYEYTDGFNVFIENKLPEYAVRCNTQKDAEDKAKEAKDDRIYVYPVKSYKDLNGNIYKDYQLSSSKFGVATNKQQMVEINKTGKIPVYRIPNVPIDYIAEYLLHRNINGKDITAIGRFTYSEAIEAGFFEKDTYKKYPKVLIKHRAFTYGAREIASDIMMGVMEATELKIINGSELSSDEITAVEDAEVID